jgi:hypothetical protein
MLTRTQMVGELGSWLEVPTASGSEGETTLIRCLDWGFRRVWYSRFWPERATVIQLYTAGPYSTGTCDFTNLSTAVTGTGTTWTAAMTGRKIAKSLSSPPYVFTRTASTTGTIAPATGYAEATSLLSGYTIYADELDIATDVDVIYSVECLRFDYGGQMTKVPEDSLDQGLLVHGVTGIPTRYAQTREATAGTKRIRVFPIPDQVYRLRVRYWKSYTDMTGASSTCPLGANKEMLGMKAAALYAQNLSDVRPVTSEAEVAALIDQVWKDQQEAVPMGFTREAFDSRISTGGLFLNSDNLGL